MGEMLNTKLDEVESSLIDTYELALAYGDEASKNHEAFHQIFEDVVKIKQNATLYEQALEKVRDQLTLEDLEREYETQLKNGNKNFQANKTREFKAFQSRLQLIKESFDCEDNMETGTGNNRYESDEMVMETHVQIIDPLTKRRMENPVKNQLCGHHYEKSSILEAIRINSRLRCPVAGCGNKQLIQKNHLVDDDALKIQIMRMGNQNPDYDDDDDDPLAL